MEVIHQRQTIEIFHLLFLRNLENVMDKSLYALKGGGNLRFFFKSIRYSEDLDFDVKSVAVFTLRSKMNKLLKSVSFLKILETQSMEIVHMTEPKQTETTQRWKIGLKTPSSSLVLPTKIEFSRRGLKDPLEFGPIEPEIIHSYHLYQILCSHYTKDAALTQKWEALLNRAETQARDIFDLNHLLELGAKVLPRFKELKSYTSSLLNLIDKVDYGAYQSQVVAYLPTSYQDYYSSKELWKKMKSRITANLED